MFRIPELKRRLLFTGMILLIYRLGGHVPTPGINRSALSAFFDSQSGSLMGLYDMFSGGNLSNATVFALGIMPYISASIIFQLLQAVVPYFEKLAKEGEAGRKKITQYTRFATVGLALVQSFGMAAGLEQMSGGIVTTPGLGFKLLTMITLTAGTVFVMWLGEQITERGIGNGISMIIFIGIVVRYPTDILNTGQQLASGDMHILKALAVAAFMLFVVAGIIAITQGQRKIPVQYAKKIVGRRVYGGANTHIPLKVNTAGVIPIIFAQSIIMFPATLMNIFPDVGFLASLGRLFIPPNPVYVIVYSTLIILFAYFYTAVILNPVDLADNMKKNSGFIPGVRPGKKTAEYIDRVLTRVTLPGAVFLAVIAILPDLMISFLQVPFYFGGTGLLIVVGVALDTLQQIESHLVMRHYDGFMSKGRLRARR
ncbi:MAG: preprotein translocase subunit SecY [Candidatus Krumholzibacteriia bacterium]|jgi:preprotein translocase subunit SecY